MARGKGVSGERASGLMWAVRLGGGGWGGGGGGGGGAPGGGPPGQPREWAAWLSWAEGRRT
jgi:hypothetical protein